MEWKFFSEGLFSINLSIEKKIIIFVQNSGEGANLENDVLKKYLR